ncbi:MAG: glycosyltransferase family 4 protein [Coriobacteriia bacterium]|nr:glycosyltransferase family 4 protein [Coriobacteriia bacterium]
MLYTWAHTRPGSGHHRAGRTTVRHIVMISQIPLWSMGRSVGGPAFEQTVLGLSRHFRISLVQPRVEHVDTSDLPDNVTLHPFEHRFHGLWRQVRKLGWITDTLGWYSFASSAWPIVRELCDGGDVDLVYGYEIYGAPVARRAATAFALPMVSRFQGTLMSERRHMPFSRIRFHKHVAGLSTPADLVIMTNDGTLGRDYLLSLGHPAERIRFWMNGVDPSIACVPFNDARPALGVPADAPMLLTVSRLSGWKRVDRAIRAVGELSRRGVDTYLAIAGVGPDEGRLRALADERGVAERTRFAGAVPRHELASLYRSADLLLSLYDYSNLGNPVIEAMMLGLPVLALDVGGTGDLVKDGVNGVLVPDADDAALLADRIGALLVNRPALRESGARAAAWARENLWSWDERVQAEADALGALIEAHSASQARRQA